MLSDLRKSKLAANAVLLLFAFSLFGAAPARAEERYPDVARISFVSGAVTYSRGDNPDEWDDAIENVPLTVGDRIYAPADGRAEVELSSGNFVRLASRSYLSAVNLSDDIKQFYLGEGAAAFDIRRLPSDEDFEIDTPNVSVTFEGPGRYRVAVDENGDSRITVRRGRATVAANGRQIAVENSEIRIYGSDSPRYEIVGLPVPDAFDRWVDERNDRFDRAYADAYRYASEDIVGATDLNGYGRWENIPEYGYAWTPAVVAAGWAPFSSGRWYWQDPWGWSWISNERWGWATSHYGRWVPYLSRWYWVPVRPRTRVRYAPACVEFVRVGDNIGWFPLHPRDRYTPWWQRRDRRFDDNVLYVNRNYITVVNQNNFISARPVNRYLVRDAAILRQVRSARLTESLPIPNRSSLRIVSDNGVRRGFKPSAAVLNRAAVVRTAPPAPPRAFQDKLAEIQKNQGRAVEPAAAASSERGNRIRFRPAAETGRGEFAPRNPGTTGRPALQPVTEARGKKLATRNGGGNDSAKTVESKNIPVAPLAPAQPSKATPNRIEPPRQTPQEIERQKQAQERQRQQQLQEQRQRESERRRAQQQEDERKVQAQKQAPQERQVEQRSREQQRLEELERRQAQQEADGKAQQQRREQTKQQERQTQQRQQELEHRQQEERKAQTLQQQQQQQEQSRREQLNQQQQAQQRQAREQQLRQQQTQQLQRREEQERRPTPPPRRPQPQEQPAPQPQIQR